MKKIIIISIVFLVSCNMVYSISPRVHYTYDLFVGLNSKKSIGLYWENGFDLNYQKIKSKFSFGASYLTSRLGSAIYSNAIKQDNFLVYSDYEINIFSIIENEDKKEKVYTSTDFEYYIKHKITFNPRLNIGYFYSDYESEIFDELRNTSLLVSPELVFSYRFLDKIKLQSSFGYNILHGDGSNGVGTLYPFYFRFSLSYLIYKGFKVDGDTDEDI